MDGFSLIDACSFAAISTEEGIDGDLLRQTQNGANILRRGGNNIDSASA